VYSIVCGLMVIYRYMIKRPGLIRNGRLWMVLLQRPLWGRGIGPNPIDRAKCGTKRSILVDGKTEHNSKIKHS